MHGFDSADASLRPAPSEASHEMLVDLANAFNLNIKHDSDSVSKVIDQQTGEPLVMYHGTKADFSIFDPTLTNPTSGVFLAANKDHANQFAGGRSYGGNVMSLFASLKNPRILNDGEYNMTNLESATANKSIDGVIALNEDGSIYTAIAKESNQLKSSTGNNGNFDGSNPDIRASVDFNPSDYSGSSSRQIDQ